MFDAMKELRPCFKSFFCSMISIGALVAGTGAASALVIDDFSQGPLSIQATNNYPGQTVVESGLDPATALGGSRSIYVGSLNQASVNVDTTKGRFNFSADVNFGYFTLEWGSGTPLNINLTAGGNNAFALSFVDVTPVINPGLWEFRIKSGNTWFTYDMSRDFYNAFNTQTFGTLALPFSKFAGADLTQVQAIELMAARFQPASGLSIDSIVTAVPEPATTALLGIVSLLSWLSCPRRKKLLFH